MDNLEELLEEIEDVKRFGEEELGLEFGDAFSEVDLKRPPHFYFLYVSRRDRIEAPRLLGLPRGECSISFNRRWGAEMRQKWLERRGIDTLLYEAEGVGSDTCPITRSLLEADPERRAEVVLHEGFHINLFLKWQRDYDEGLESIWNLPYELDEAIASVCGNICSLEYLEQKGADPEVIEDAQYNHDWWLEYADSINSYYEELQACYRRGGSDRETILARAHKEMSSELEEGQKLNNAYFLRGRLYTQHTPHVHEVFQQIAIRDYLADPAEVHAHLLQAVQEKD